MIPGPGTRSSTLSALRVLGMSVHTVDYTAIIFKRLSTTFAYFSPFQVTFLPDSGGVEKLAAHRVVGVGLNGPWSGNTIVHAVCVPMRI